MFSYQCSFLLLPFHATAFILYQRRFMFVNNFLFIFVLHLKLSFLMHQLVYNNIICFPECQALFSTFFHIFLICILHSILCFIGLPLFSFEQNGERGIRTLAPLLTTYPLPGPPPPAGYFPKNPYFIYTRFFFLKNNFLKFYIFYLLN